MSFWGPEQDQKNVDAGRARWLSCPGPGHQPCAHTGRYLNYAQPPRKGGWYADEGACFPCRKDRQKHLKLGYAAAARKRAKVQRATTAAPCGVCGGPLWPDGVVPVRARSDRTTCSDRCRQAKRRHG